MDPDEALKKARAALKAFHDAPDAERSMIAGADLADAFEALDGWLSKGGFLPRDWQREYQRKA
jgi:hypothetical protein